MAIGQHRKDLTDEQVLTAYRSHETLRDAARALKTTTGTVRTRLEKMGEFNKEAPKIEMPVLPSDNPTAEELLEMRERETSRVFKAAAAREWMPVRVKTAGPTARVQVFHDVEAGAEYLKWLRSRQ